MGLLCGCLMWVLLGLSWGSNHGVNVSIFFQPLESETVPLPGQVNLWIGFQGRSFTKEIRSAVENFVLLEKKLKSCLKNYYTC